MYAWLEENNEFGEDPCIINCLREARHRWSYSGNRWQCFYDLGLNLCEYVDVVAVILICLATDLRNHFMHYGCMCVCNIRYIYFY